MIIELLWFIAVFVIFFALIGYPLSLLLLEKIFYKKENKKNFAYEPTVTVMIVAHNEEGVIEEKMNNLLQIDYPREKIDFVVTSDFSTDNTNVIVEKFIKKYPERRIRIHKCRNHCGKTNAQNEAQQLVTSEILVMTDANSILEKNTIRELVSSFISDEIVYVSGRLKYINIDNKTAKLENFYWRMELKCRNIESKIQTITGGNDAIYAIRNKYYENIPSIECHDSSFPLLFALKGKRCVYNENAVALEKAGETDEDEFKRKVRMNRIILHAIMPNLHILNIFAYRWFSFFYLGHRSCRYLLWLMHLLVLVLNIILVLNNYFWLFILSIQITFYVLALYGTLTKSGNAVLRFIVYYTMAIIAQWHAVIKIIKKEHKCTWEKAESTR